MYCRNCGAEMNENAVACMNCGLAKGNGANYCHTCGCETNTQAVVCVKCGVSLKNNRGIFNTNSGGGALGANSGEKSKILACVLAVFLGFLGAHYFYLGFKKNGIVRTVIAVLAFILKKMFGGFLMSFSTLSFLGTIGTLILIILVVLGIIDAVRIYQGKMNDSNGKSLS